MEDRNHLSRTSSVEVVTEISVPAVDAVVDVDDVDTVTCDAPLPGALDVHCDGGIWGIV
jgi:hypothetical protein